MLGAACGEIGNQVLIGVAELLRADHPDSLAPQLVAQRLEGADLINRAHHPAPALAVGAVRQLLPVPGQPVVHRDRLACRVVGQARRADVAADQRQRVQHRPVRAAAAELEHLQQPDQAAAVVVGVRGPVGSLHRAPPGWPRRLVLRHQVPQVLLTHHREHHRADRVIRAGQRRVGHPEQQALFPLHPPERVHQLGGHLPLSPGPDPVHRRQQHGHQRIGDLPAAAEHQRRQQRDHQLRRMRAQVTGRLDHRLIPPLLQRRRTHISEQAGRQTERGQRRQLLGLGQHRRQADRARRGLDPAKQIRLRVIPGILARPGQRQQPGDRLRIQPGRDPPGQPLASLEQR